ncbi:MAG TPA: hypothetical protein VIV56_07135 [Gemmatimonadales bacterium]
MRRLAFYGLLTLITVTCVLWQWWLGLAALWSFVGGALYGVGMVTAARVNARRTARREALERAHARARELGLGVRRS